VTARRVDVHAHYLPADYRQALLDGGHAQPDGFPVLPEWSAEAHLAMMDRVGVETSLLSVSTPGVTFGGDPVEWARRVNESGAATVREHPGRFGLFASLPVNDADAARDEVAYALDRLGADGVVLLTHADGVYLGDPRLEPVMAELHRRRAVVFVHPTSPAGFECTALGYPRPMLEFLLDTTRAIANLVLTGTLDRYDGIRLIVPHAGAALPVVADRLAGFASLFGVGGREAGEVDVVATLQRLYYEIGAGAPFPRHVDALLNLVDAGRLLFGTDFPFGGVAGIEANVEALGAHPGIDDERLRANTEELFPRLRRP
jgi:predicted TIM-barrel fold metal-dependent hydrolase